MNITIKSPLGEQNFEMADHLAMAVIYQAYRYANQQTDEGMAHPELRRAIEEAGRRFENFTESAGGDEETTQKPSHASSRGRSRVENLFGDKKDWHTEKAVREPQRASQDEEPGEEYRGFLLIKCEKCGAVKGFCAKNPITRHRCNCGHETPLRDLRPAHLKCKCGQQYKYRTNMSEQTFTYNCLNCGGPVDMELNKRETAYVTIGATRGGGVLIGSHAPTRSRYTRGHNIFE